ncbi:ABC-type polysaccharide/polyol phosphate transport system, ATPase component [Beggiatoa alba B18LD]|uniref:ABC-type polysaccharide/polyol phosphate transport system, ATPase component n=1 Tax=Beggiatoa alba B18LD TaxID=395493 RepID=I3CHR0_9GAMM|nr:ABC transporter ATP-binding protein [Beggiatoa alba]EIJ43153.1 ABC-type polysaccharide/polyol phosphate transport system, ATPase component [Beggiatoa alba B18LD]
MPVIRLENICKTYSYYEHGVDRLLEILTKRRHHEEFIALHPLNLHIENGQVIGIIGNNGAGKSTLLKIIAGTLKPDNGLCEVTGRVSALLELGGGFHPDMTGRENVYLNGTMMGLTIPEIDQIYQTIVEFAGIQEFMDHPVKTYSSGMFVRLAFAVATCVEPDILIVDEALSVGDGAFARKSFNRIMQFKQAGKTILFCSHSMYQIEAICDRVIWLEHGQIKMDGVPSSVVSAYTESLSQNTNAQLQANTTPVENTPVVASSQIVEGTAKIKEVSVTVDGMTDKKLDVFSLRSELCITVKFSSDISLPSPTVGILIINADGRFITSAGTQHDGLPIQRDSNGIATVRVTFPKLALLKGEYWVDIFLLCENAIHVYDHASTVATLNVRQKGLEQGVVSLPRQWAQI